MSLASRLRRLERAAPRAEGPCRRPIFGAIVDAAGEGPGPAHGPDGDLTICPNCGGVHVLTIIEEIAEAPAAPPSIP
jgi:hypothetical protein